jgi:hypothetical protein
VPESNRRLDEVAADRRAIPAGPVTRRESRQVLECVVEVRSVRGVKPPPDLLPLSRAHVLVASIAPQIPLFSLTRIYWRKRHRVPVVKIGKFVYYPRHELEMWAKQFAKENP